MFSPGRPTSSRSVWVESRLSAGPTVSVVVNIQSAKRAARGTVTRAIIFARIDQLPVFMRPRPSGYGTAALGRIHCRRKYQGAPSSAKMDTATALRRVLLEFFRPRGLSIMVERELL